MNHSNGGHCPEQWLRVNSLKREKHIFPLFGAIVQMKQTHQSHGYLAEGWMLLLCPHQKHILEESSSHKEQGLWVLALCLPLTKCSSGRSFQFFLPQFLHLLNERDYIDLEVLLVLRIIDLGSFHFSATFWLITGILLPTERSFDTRYGHLRAWQVVRSCFSPPLAQLLLWSREIGHSYDWHHLNGMYFNLHKDVCIPCRKSLGSYLLSVSPDNMLCHGKGK